MKAVIEIPDLPATVRSLRFYPPLSDAELEDFCSRNDDYRIERTRKGVIQVLTPTGLDTGGGNAELIVQLRVWVKKYRKGRAFDSNAGFYLPDGSMLSPDASFLSNETLAKVPEGGRKHIPHICPDFVIELISESDTLAGSKKKMTLWIINGVKLGWLVEPKKERIWVYLPDAAEPATISGSFIEGTGPIEGFRLDLEELWEEYR